jgi:ApbE superfamily uncharacterized protein (UPF0280 family)
MNCPAYQKRSYRDWVREKDLIRTVLTVRETDLQILSDKPLDLAAVKAEISKLRDDIESYIQKDRRFLVSLKPIPVELHAKPIVKSMAKAAYEANVGPMAAVAGAIAQYLGKYLISKGMEEVIIENGGDVFLKTKKLRYVGIYAGKSRAFNNKLFLKIRPQASGLGICASSGTVGHSLSFGKADALAIIAKNAAVADAAATACANVIQSKADFARAIELARKIKGVAGIIIILNNNMACWGKIEFATRRHPRNTS